MNVVDSCGWLEYFANDTNAGFFAPAIEDRMAGVVPSVCLHEVYKRTSLLADRDAAVNAVALMRRSMVVPLTDIIACYAAELAMRWKLSLADSVILATAHKLEAVLWTQDAHFKDIPGVRYIKK